MNLEDIKNKINENAIFFSRKASKLNILRTIVTMISTCIVGYFSIYFAKFKSDTNYIFYGIFVIYMLSITSQFIYNRLYNIIIQNEYKIARELFCNITDKENLEMLINYCDKVINK